MNIQQLALRFCSNAYVFTQRMNLHKFLVILLLTEIQFFGVSIGDDSTWRSGPPDGLPELSKLSVECGKEEMTIHLEFSAPYDGTIYSKSNGQSQRCIHIAPHSHITEATFSVDYHSCGTRSDSQGKFYENTIIIQYDDTVIEAWDEAKKIRCEWHDGYEKSAYKMPITISDLDVVEMNFQGDDVDCWLEVQDGKGPWSAKVEGLVPLGSPLTLVVAIQDSEGQFDMRVKSCIAHDGHKHPIHLTDEDGCVLRPKMMSPFQKTSDTKGTASVIAYSHFYAFKFPETVEVTIQCTVEICRHGCPDTCLQGRDAQTSNPADTYLPQQGKEQDEDIPTYKDTHAFSTVITSKPSLGNISTNTSGNLNETIGDPEPLKSSPDTHHGYYTDRYPYDIYDVLEADERRDTNEHELYTDTEDNEYAENRDDVYFSQVPNVYNTDVNEWGKNFPSDQKIENVSMQTESTTYSPDASSTMEDIHSRTEEKEYVTTKQNSEVEKGLADSDDKVETDSEIINEKHSEINAVTENPASGNPLPTDASKPFAEKTQENILNQLFSSELFEDSPDDVVPEVKEEALAELNPEQLKTESLHESDTDIGMKSAYESNSDKRNAYKERLDRYEYGEKRMIDSTGHKLPDKSFENFKIKARTPLDNNERRHNLHNFNYRPFMPPVPVPPLTLYNGVPLHYYNHPSPHEEFLERDGYEYMGRQPYHTEYIKSKLRRPGRRRGRREIGEKEQLGLKQTLRVIATTDFDFVEKNNDKIQPLYVVKPDTNNEVCVAPSSFAAGLGLILIANICVLCVAVFLGHHYYLHKNKKVKNTELLCTEMT